MSSPWQEYRKKLTATPLGLLNTANFATDDVINARMDICLDCDKLIHLTKQCKECGCVMALKTKLINAKCPLGKW